MKETNGKKKDSIKQQVNELYEVMKNEHLEELEIKKDDFHIHLKRKNFIFTPKLIFFINV